MIIISINILRLLSPTEEIPYEMHPLSGVIAFRDPFPSIGRVESDRLLSRLYGLFS